MALPYAFMDSRLHFGKVMPSSLLGSPSSPPQRGATDGKSSHVLGRAAHKPACPSASLDRFESRPPLGRWSLMGSATFQPLPCPSESGCSPRRWPSRPSASSLLLRCRPMLPVLEASAEPASQGWAWSSRWGTSSCDCSLSRLLEWGGVPSAPAVEDPPDRVGRCACRMLSPLSSPVVRPW